MKTNEGVGLKESAKSLHISGFWGAVNASFASIVVLSAGFYGGVIPAIAGATGIIVYWLYQIYSKPTR